ncbi:MAG TPA: 3-oxoacyl-[acyl-carrier-protein] reductase [Ruminococcaceae bacterium]|jgi:3-oxoacyl-[acyl-carrier protein] reductase|nr:3-oxoacyl-[acyl-carrier-protein] reductase [Oscillospiraceae bacterium]
MSLKGKAAIVTGGGRGIGRAVCLEFARRGANLVVNYAGNAEAAEQTARDCRDLGVQAVTVRADVSVSAECAAIFDKAKETFGRVDILVNNAGITRDGLIARMSEEDFDAVLDTNLKGAFLCMKLAARLMMKQRSGRIISVSSVVALRGNPGQANYAASKAGLIGMTKSLAKELAARNVTVNAVAPGMIRTDMTNSLPDRAKQAILDSIPLARLGTPEDVAKAVAFFAGDDADYITGQVLRVDGGMAM